MSGGLNDKRKSNAFPLSQLLIFLVILSSRLLSMSMTHHTAMLLAFMIIINQPFLQFRITMYLQFKFKLKTVPCQKIFSLGRPLDCSDKTHPKFQIAAGEETILCGCSNQVEPRDQLICSRSQYLFVCHGLQPPTLLPTCIRGDPHHCTLHTYIIASCNRKMH